MGWRIVLIAILSNLCFKIGMAATLGSRAFAVRLGALGAITVAAGLGVLVFWR